MGVSVRFWAVVEGIAPGALKAFQRGQGQILSSGEVPIPQRLTAFLSQLANRPMEEIRPAVDAEFERLSRKVEKAGTAFKVLWDALTPRERMVAERRLQAATAMAACLTSVVHV